MRSLCRPPKGKIIVGIDYKSEEFLISGLLANDKNMLDAYESGDVYLYFAKLAGAVPKDGPSAGVTMCTAMISTLTGGAVKKDVAMTGEITLRGKVLPVGGIREKVLAAHRAGIKKVLLPRENEKDLEDIPEVVRKEMAFVLIETVDEALEHAMVKRPKSKKTTKAAQPKTVGKKKMS